MSERGSELAAELPLGQPDEYLEPELTTPSLHLVDQVEEESRLSESPVETEQPVDGTIDSDSASFSGLHMQLLRIRRQARHTNDQDRPEKYEVTPQVKKLRKVDVPGLGLTPVSDFVSIMQSETVSPGVRDAAFDVDFNKFRKPLADYLSCTVLGTFPDLIPDAVQIALTKVYTKIGMYKPGPHLDSFTGWVLTITQRCAIDVLRQNRRQIPFSAIYGDSPPPQELVPLTSNLHIGADPYDVLETKENLECVRQLPDDQRIVLGERLLGYRPQEIARAHDKSEPSIHGLVHRGRRQSQENYRRSLSQEI